MVVDTFESQHLEDRNKWTSVSERKTNQNSGGETLSQN